MAAEYGLELLVAVGADLVQLQYAVAAAGMLQAPSRGRPVVGDGGSSRAAASWCLARGFVLKPNGLVDTDEQAKP